jgi:hypothetical protein
MSPPEKGGHQLHFSSSLTIIDTLQVNGDLLNTVKGNMDQTLEYPRTSPVPLIGIKLKAALPIDIKPTQIISA